MKKKFSSASTLIKVKPSNLYSCPVTTHIPGQGTRENRALHYWLNLQHCGSEIPPAEVNTEHMNASYALCRHYQGVLDLRVNRDGTPTPISLEWGGKRYALTEE